MTSFNIDQWLSGEEGTWVVEAVARAQYPELKQLFPASFFADQEWEQLPSSAVGILCELAIVALRAALSLTTTCKTCEGSGTDACCCNESATPSPPIAPSRK